MLLVDFVSLYFWSFCFCDIFSTFIFLLHLFLDGWVVLFFWLLFLQWNSGLFFHTEFEEIYLILYRNFRDGVLILGCSWTEFSKFLV